MVVYFADRIMNILGLASTELMEEFTISDDLKTEETDTGVATFECTIHWDNSSRLRAEECTAAGNYLLRSNDGENEFYTIIEAVNDTKNQSIEIYAEDAGMDLLNETVGAYEATEAHPVAWYIEMYAEDTGFEIGINEISNLTRTLKWEGEATAAERIASVATEFDNAEISYSFEIKNLVITHKYINIHKKRGKDAGYQLRLNRDIDRIVTTTSVADLATALYVTGGTPEGKDTPITLEGYSYDDGDIYVMAGSPILCSRSALNEWSRYVWAKEPNQIEGYTGNIVKQWSYDTTSQSELCNRAITQLKKVSEPAVNYEIDITTLPENVGIGDYVDIVDEKGELYLSSRILKLTTSIVNQKQTATLGEFLIKESGISETVRELAEQFSQLAKSRQFYTWIAYADDEYGDGISLDPTDKAYMGTATNMTTAEVDISDPSVFKWSLIQGEGVGIENIITWYGKSDTPTEVPTEWQDEPYELLHNEYQWSYVEYDYTNGVVVYTEPHIIAYYDFLSVDELEARVAKIEEAYVSYEEVELLVADDVEAAIVNAGFLTADSAIIVNLEAFSESVYTLLGGEGSFGELDVIHLSSDNAVIDQAVIVNAIADTILAELITAEYINTNQITIMSEDGGIIISGNQIQVTTGQTIYYDENGNPRIQIGQDADGNFTFIIYNETGTGIMMDSEGIHESAVPDGLIVDSMVAEGAGIQGSKLDIGSVAQCLTEDGTLEVTAGQVTINDTTLETWYTEVTQELEGLSGLTSEGLMNVEPWFCLWTSDTDVPPADEDLTPAICGEAICGFTICGQTDGTLWVPDDMPVINNLYKWVKWKGYYADGHEEWGNPYCLTDGYLRQETSVLQTEFQVVQGEISAKIWMTDITEAINTTMTDLWSELDVTLDGIEAQVGSLVTTTGTLTSQMADIEITTEGITQTVTNIEQQIAGLDLEGVSKIEPWFCLWYSATETPLDEITPAICGEAICGMTFCGVIDGTLWTTDEPADREGFYKWIRYLLYYQDGHTEWSEPYCLTDDYVRTEVASTYSQIEQLADSITIEVGALYNDIESNYATKASLVLQLDQSTGIATLSADADVIQLTSGQISIESDNFVLTPDGVIYATSGTIGGWVIGVNSLYNGADSLTSLDDGIYLGIDGIREYSDGDYLNITSAVLVNGNEERDIQITDGRISIDYNGSNMGFIYSADFSETAEIGMSIITNTSYLGIGYSANGVNYLCYQLNNGLNPDGYKETHLFYGNARFREFVYIAESLVVDTIATDSEAPLYVQTYRIDLGWYNTEIGIYDHDNSRWLIGRDSSNDLRLEYSSGTYKPYYSAGDSLSGTLNLTGYTNASNSAFFLVPLCRPVLGSPSVSVSISSISIALNGSLVANSVSPSSVSASVTNYGIAVTASVSALSSYNYYPLGINVTLSIRFS